MAGTSAIVFLPDDTARTGLDRPLMLTELMGSTLLGWLGGILYRGGTRRMLLVCHDQWSAQALESCPKSILTDTASVGQGAVDCLRTFLAGAEAWEEIITVITGPVAFRCWTALSPTQEPDQAPGTPCGVWDAALEALRDAVDTQADSFDFMSFLQTSASPYTSRDGLAAVSSYDELRAWLPTLRDARNRELEDCGAQLWDSSAVWAGPEVTVGQGTVLMPGTILRGNTSIAPGCTIGPNAMLWNAAVGQGSVVNASQVYDSSIGAYASVGPYACLRPGTVLEDGAKVGAFSETKNATLGRNARLEGHGYLGEADVGQSAVLGPGTVTVDHDGEHLWRSKIGENAWVGGNATLSAPVELGGECYIAPGSAITENVPDRALGVACNRQTNQKEYQKRRKR